MRYLLIFFLGLLLGSTAHSAQAQADSTFVPDSTATIAYWDLGDKKTFLRTHTQYADSSGQVVDLQVSSTLVSFEVIDSTFESYTIRYVVDSILMGADKYWDGEELDLGLLKGLRFEYVTDTYGEFLYLVNEDEVRNQVKSLVRSLSFPQYSPSTGEDIKQDLYNLYDQEGSLEQYLLYEIGMLHTYNGYTLPVYQEIDYETEYPNLLNTNIPAIADGMLEVTVTDLGRSLRFETFEVIDSLEENQPFMDLLYVYLLGEEIGDLDNLPSSEELNAIRISLEDEWTVVYDFQTGWFKEAYFERVFYLSDGMDTYNLFEITNYQLLNR